MPLEQKTIRYKTWIKESIVQAMRRAFSAHLDDLLQEVRVTIEFPMEENHYPALLVKFYEKEITNAGVGHSELIEVEGSLFKFNHYFYKGDIEFNINALSSYDRDLIGDSLIQILGMGRLEQWTIGFFNRIYDVHGYNFWPEGHFNHLNINTDVISGFGETQLPAPWLPEDVLVYQIGYRVGIAGGFYSLPPDTNDSLDLVDNVDVYPYIEDLEPIPDGADDDAIWTPPLSEE